jgi:hypothetical protein
LFRGQCGRPAQEFAPLPGRLNAGAGSFSHQAALTLRETAHHVLDRTAGRGGVHALGERLEPEAIFAEVADHGPERPRRAAKWSSLHTVKTPPSSNAESEPLCMELVAAAAAAAGKTDKLSPSS